MRDIVASLARILWTVLRYHTVKVFVVVGLAYLIGMSIAGFMAGRVR